MKKYINLLVLVLLLTFSTAAVAEAAGDITVLVNNHKIAFPDQKPYIDKNNRTLVPVRFVSEALGAKVDWNAETRVVTISKEDRTITLKIGESKAAVNGRTRYFDTKAVIAGSRTMVPLRFISECLGATVEWLAKTRTVKITVNNGYTIPEGT
ncbi:copper amine oxidase N-terminal domain-containing protein, partial [Thermincola ferriacetica]|uniref:copper amine oxidase N-terminal domain-containing protein n=1 Tax=Thermincola ferriacetica TaxID=281456 RepID=UPI001364DD62